MYINAFKANSYSYIEKNFASMEEAMQYLKTDSLTFTRGQNGLGTIARHGNWQITTQPGEMPDEGDGFVDMAEESGALDYIL